MFAFEFASRKTTLSYQILPRLTGSIQTNTRFPFQTRSSSRSANKISTRSDGVTRAFTNSFNSGPAWQPVAAAAVAGRFHPHWQLGGSKLEPPQLRRELYNATERGSLIQATIRQSETVLVLSAAQRLHCLTAQTTMPRAEITGNASLSDRGEKQRERQRESVMASSLFTYRLIEKKKAIVSAEQKKNLVFTHQCHPSRFSSYKWHLLRENAGKNIMKEGKSIIFLI